MTSTVTQKLNRLTKQPIAERNKTISTKTTTDAVAILEKRFGSPEATAYMIEYLEQILIGNQIYDLRTNAGMTQSALAKKVGIKVSEIDCLESADYEGVGYAEHPLPLLRKIADVFGMRLELNFVPMDKKEIRTSPPLPKPSEQTK